MYIPLTSPRLQHNIVIKTCKKNKQIQISPYLCLANNYWQKPGSISLEDNTGDEDKKIQMKSRILVTLKVVIVKL